KTFFEAAGMFVPARRFVGAVAPGPPAGNGAAPAGRVQGLRAKNARLSFRRSADRCGGIAHLVARSHSARPRKAASPADREFISLRRRSRLRGRNRKRRNRRTTLRRRNREANEFHITFESSKFRRF